MSLIEPPPPRPSRPTIVESRERSARARELATQGEQAMQRSQALMDTTARILAAFAARRSLQAR